MNPNYMVGNNWDLELLDGLIKLNAVHTNGPQVTELFGSLSNLNPFGTARPAFRIQKRTVGELEIFAAKAKQHEIGLNYTANVSMVDPRVLRERVSEIKDFLFLLNDLGFVRITCAHPLVAELVAKHSQIPIELSTILQVNGPRQLRLLKERIPTVDKVCVDVFKNRDFAWLAEFKLACEELDIVPELLVNEFCIQDCVDRNFCYDLHSLNLSQEDTHLFAHYPMGRCMALRSSQPQEWLMARFILPQNVQDYMDRGYTHFKISGRTHPTDYILRTTAAYLRGEYRGNLPELWGQLERIDNPEARVRSEILVGPDEALTKDFLQPWLDGEFSTEGEEWAYCMRILKEKPSKKSV